MNGNLPASWTISAAKAAGTLLFVAVAAFVAWQLLKHLMPVLVVVVALLAIYRWLVRGRM